MTNTRQYRVTELSDGGVLTISDEIPADIKDRRRTVRSAQIYVFAGFLKGSASHEGFLAAYLGKSSALFRAEASFQRWVLGLDALIPTGLAVIHRTAKYDRDVLSYLEARCIQLLINGPHICMLNSQTSANLAGARLTHQEILQSMDLADEIHQHLWDGLFHRRTNSPAAPVSNAREAAIRVVLGARRALDINDITKGVVEAGWHLGTRTPDRSVRRAT